MITTREEYLMEAVEKFRPLFSTHKLNIPPVKVSCGFPSKSPLKNLGQCWSPECTPDKVTCHIFVSPTHLNGIQTLGTLARELCHACLPDDAKFGSLFKDAIKAIGLEGPARTAVPGHALLEYIEQMADELGDYPNPTLQPKPPKMRDKAASKKSFKLFCSKKRNADKGCTLTGLTTGGDYTVTASRKSLALGFPLCPGCAQDMEMEAEDYELYKLASN